MLTWGRFVCHVHCLVHDGVVRSSPCGPHHKNFIRNLYHMFVPAYSASQSFVLSSLWYSSCFKVKCGIHTFPKRCSHTSICILILLDHRGCRVNPFQPTCFSLSGFDLFQHPQDHLSVFPTLFISSVLKLPLFFPPTHPFSSRTQIS